MCIGMCRYGRAEAAARCGSEAGAGDMVGALHVADCGLGAEGGTKVAEALVANSTLTKLNLSCE